MVEDITSRDLALLSEGFFRQHKRNARMDDNANVEFYHLKNVSDLFVKLLNKQ